MSPKINDLNPEERKRLNKKVITFGCLPISIILIGIIMIVNSSDDQGNSKEMQSDKVELVNPELEQDISHDNFKYYFGEKDKYSVKVKIDTVILETVKNAFELKEDDYSVSKKVDGLNLSVNFTITNSNSNELLVPIPNYFFIAEPKELYFSESTTYSRSCSCTIDNSTEVTYKNREIWKFTETRDRYNNYTFAFKPSESKSFTVKFSDPFVGNLNEIIFNGFNLKWNNPDYTRPRDLGFIINTKTSRITGIKKF